MYDRIYLISRLLKASRPETLRAIKKDFVPKLKRDHAHAYIGVGGLFNLNAIVAAQSDAAVIVNINSNQQELWHDIFAAMEESTDCNSFKANFKKHRKGKHFESEDRTHYWDPEKSRQGDRSYAYYNYQIFEDLGIPDEEGYQYIRHMVLDGRIAYASLDVLDTERCTQLREVIERWTTEVTRGDEKKLQSAKVATVYGSNVWDAGGPQIDIRNLQDILNNSVELARVTGEPLEKAVRQNLVEGMLAEWMNKVAADPMAKNETPKAIDRDIIIRLADKIAGSIANEHWFDANKYPSPLYDCAHHIEVELTPEEMELLKLVKIPEHDYHYRRVPAHLDGIRALGDTDTNVYLGATHRSMMQIQAGSTRKRHMPDSPDHGETIFR